MGGGLTCLGSNICLGNVARGLQHQKLTSNEGNMWEVKAHNCIQPEVLLQFLSCGNDEVFISLYKITLSYIAKSVLKVATLKLRRPSS